MTVLNDAYTPAREELTRVEGLRSGEPRREGAPTRGSDHDHAPDLTPVRGTHELHEQNEQRSTDPHGMYWVTGQDGIRRLQPHKWFVRYIAVQADSIFMITRDSVGANPEVIAQYQEMGDALRTYVESRAAVNDMVANRKFKQELDDAAYQFCQAAKYKVDAEERARFLVERDEDALDNEQINNLIERAQQAAHEGFILAMAIRHAGFNEELKFDTSAKRVLDYSCRRLTEWFSAREQAQADRRSMTVAATRSIVNNMFLRRQAG